MFFGDGIAKLCLTKSDNFTHTLVFHPPISEDFFRPVDPLWRETCWWGTYLLCNVWSTFNTNFDSGSVMQKFAIYRLLLSILRHSKKSTYFMFNTPYQIILWYCSDNVVKLNCIQETVFPDRSYGKNTLFWASIWWLPSGLSRFRCLDYELPREISYIPLNAQNSIHVTSVFPLVQEYRCRK